MIDIYPHYQGETDRTATTVPPATTIRAELRESGRSNWSVETLLPATLRGTVHCRSVQPPPLPGPNIGIVPIPAPPAIAATPSPLAILPDDPAEPSHIKMGPLGQIVKGSSAT